MTDTDTNRLRYWAMNPLEHPNGIAGLAVVPRDVLAEVAALLDEGGHLRAVEKAARLFMAYEAAAADMDKQGRIASREFAVERAQAAKAALADALQLLT